MHKSRNSLLIMLVLVAAALTASVSNAFALERISTDPGASGISRPGDTWSTGEPDGSGSGSPLPGQSPPPPRELSGRQVRGETPAPAAITFVEQVRWMSRVWAARILGVTR